MQSGLRDLRPFLHKIFALSRCYFAFPTQTNKECPRLLSGGILFFLRYLFLLPFLCNEFVAHCNISRGMSMLCFSNSVRYAVWVIKQFQNPFIDFHRYIPFAGQPALQCQGVLLLLYPFNRQITPAISLCQKVLRTRQ